MNVVAVYRDKKIQLSEDVSERFLQLSGGEDEIDVSEYVPNPVEDIKAVCVGSYNSFTEQRRLSIYDLENYHRVHSKVVALLREKQKTMKELAKHFSEISFVDPPDSEVRSIHEYYESTCNHLWEQRKEVMYMPSEDILIKEILPPINQTMIEAIATRHICAASVKLLAEAEKYYEEIFETQTDTVTHYKCYRCYLPDLGVCAVYDEGGRFIDFRYPFETDTQSLNSLIFAGFRNSVTA